MKITKYVHSCLLVETPDRVAVFDPGLMSQAAFDFKQLTRLDDIFITHIHGDHVSVDFVKQLRTAFPAARITTTQEVVDMLAKEGIAATTGAPTGVVFFNSPHESVKPVFPQPQEIGIHYLDQLTHPGDSHSFTETKAILALPVTGPWGSNIRAVNLALELKPQHVLPIHDWHWNDMARQSTYDRMAEILGEQGITFHKLETGHAVDVSR